MRRLYVALVLTLLVTLLGPLAPSATAATPPGYNISATYDYPTGVGTATERLHYVNQSGSTLSTIAFTVVLRHFGAFTLTGAKVNGVSVTTRQSDVNLTLVLNRALPNLSAADVQIDYRFSVPAQAFIRFGRSNGIHALGNWYPTVQVPKNGVWPNYRYVDTGDAFSSEAASYNVTLDVRNAPTSLKVAHSGDLVSRTGNRFVMSGQNLREFAISMSARYATLTRLVGSTRITVYYLPEHLQGATRIANGAASALAWGNARLGVYPHANLRLAETMDAGGSGQEYATIIFMGSGDMWSSTASLYYLVAHEVFHQWFYQQVGNDQVSEPWLDEGLATHLGYQFIKTVLPASYPSMWQALINRYHWGVSTYGDRYLDTTIYDYPSDTAYFAILYRKSALFLEEVRVKLGSTSYFNMLRYYAYAKRNGISSTPYFLKRIIAWLPVSGPGMIRRYFSTRTTTALGI